MAYAVRPARYIPQSYRNNREALAAAIAEQLEAKGLTAADLHKRWRSCRAAHIDALTNPERPLPDLKMLHAIAEAAGLRITFQVHS